MTTRAFVGIELDGSTRSLLGAAAAAVREADPTWAGEKWVPAGNLHVTLRFLGAVEDRLLDGLGDALEHACADRSPFEMRLASVDAAGRGGRVRMLWATFSAGVHECRELAEAVLEGTAPFAPAEGDPRRFSPHVTLVRARRPRPIDPAALTDASTVVAGQIGSPSSSPTSGSAVSVHTATLFSSTLGSAGPTYEVLARATLGAD
jgi:2'-5' RNA ligase